MTSNRKLLAALGLTVLVMGFAFLGAARAQDVSLPFDTRASGSISATSGVVTMLTNGRSTAALSVTGTWSGALTVRVSVDYAQVGAANATWGTSSAVSLANGSILSAITGNGIYQINASGFSAIQVFGTNIVSGTANISLAGSSGVSTVMADNPIPVTPSGIFTIGPYAYTPLSPGQYTPVSDATATSLTIPTGATYAVVCFEGANHRFTWDGTTTPTASIGTLISFGPGACMYLSGAAIIANFKTISVTAGGTFTASYAR